MSVSPSVHLSTIQKVSQSVNKFNSSPVSQSTIKTVSLSVINQATQLINQALFYQWINHSNSYSTVQKQVDSPLRVLILDAIHNSRFLCESRIKNQESRTSYWQWSWGSSLAGQKKKRLTHDWFFDNFAKKYSCNTTQHGYIRASNCMLRKRQIQVVKRMFHQGHYFVSSFISSSFKLLLQMQTVYNYSCTSPVRDSHLKGAGMPIRNFELRP